MYMYIVHVHVHTSLVIGVVSHFSCLNPLGGFLCACVPMVESVRVAMGYLLNNWYFSNVGDSGMVVQVIQCVKSSQSLKKVISQCTVS